MKDICPLCRVFLKFNKNLGKLACPNEGCDFVDRRVGNTVMDPAKDRRGADTTWMQIKDFK
jgi:hypothetical protein